MLFGWLIYLFYFNFYLFESVKERKREITKGGEEGEKNAHSMLSREPGMGLDPRT